MQNHLQRTLFASIAIVVLMYTFLPVGEAQVVNTDKVIYALRHPWSDLRLIAAHRRVWGTRNTYRHDPENSILAAQEATETFIKIAEVDLKETKDGTVILMHDKNLGRTTDISVDCTNITDSGKGCFNNNLFDPYTKEGWNPPVESISWDTLKKFNTRLRYQDLFVDPEDAPPTLD